MNPLESSQISKSQSSDASISAIRSKGSHVTSTFTLLIDQITQYIRIPGILYYLIFLFLLFQMIDVSLWHVHNPAIHSNEICNTTFKFIHYIAVFEPLQLDDNSTLVVFIVDTVICVIVVGILAAQFICYKQRRRFYKQTLYFTRFILELIPIIMILPTATLVGKLFLQFFNNFNGITVVFFVIVLLENISFATIAFSVNSYIGISCYLPASPLASFELTPFIQMVVITPYFGLCNFVTGHFPEWLVHPIVIVHILFISTLLTQMIYRPFIRQSTNIYFSFLLFTQFFLDIFRLALNFTSNLSYKIVLVITFACIVIGIVIPSIFYPIQHKKILKSLVMANTDDNDIPTDEEREELFNALNLGKKESKAIMYFNFIIANYQKKFLDFFPAKYLLSHYHSNRVIACCIKIITYFPSQTRTLNLIYSDMTKRRNLNFKEIFLLFQVQKVKLLRQSSSSARAIERLKELKHNSKDLEITMQSFWSLHEADIINFSDISSKVTKSRAIWEEALNDFPNSLPYREEYGNFCIECESNFSGAILQKHICDLIEAGRSFNVDMCFKLFIRNFPDYIKKNILDLKGNFMRTQKKKGSQSSNTNSNTSGQSFNTSSTSFSELDDAMEEGIGRTLITHSRIRLALQRATENRKANSYMSFMVLTWALFFIGIIIFIVIYVYFNGYFDSRKANAERLENLALTRLYLFTNILSCFYSWANRTNCANLDVYDDEFRETDDQDAPTLMNKWTSWEYRNSQFGVDSRSKFTEFSAQIAELSLHGTDVYNYMSVMFSEDVNVSYCWNGKVAQRKGQTLVTALSYIYIISDIVLSEGNLDKWFFNSIRFCNILSTGQKFGAAFDTLKQTMAKMATDEAKQATKVISKMQIAFCAGYIAVCFVVNIFVSVRYVKEINTFAMMLLKMANDIKKEASKPLRKDVPDDEKNDGNGTVDVTGRVNIAIVFIVFICLIYIINGILIVLQFNNIQYYNTQYQYLNLWTGDSMFRKPILVEITLWISQQVATYNPMVVGNHFLYENDLMKLIDEGFTNIDKMTTSLMQEGEGYPSAAGVDDIIDNILLLEDCEPEVANPSYHEMYRCGSAQQLLNFFMNSVSTIRNRINTYGGMLNDELHSTLVHITSSHLVPKMNTIDDRFNLMIATFRTKFEQIHMAYFVCEIIIIIINLTLSMLFLQYLNKCYKVALSLVRRISPILLVTDDEMVRYLLETSKKDDNAEMSTDQGIIYNSASSVLCTEMNGIVEMINPAVSATLGFSPEQLLGQSIISVIHDDFKQQIINQLELMVNKQSTLIYEDHTVCITDDESSIPCAMTILGITNESGDEVTSFVILLRDESHLLQQQEEAEKAKKQSETLLYQILPRDIVIRLNQGEKDISFSVPSATIMFIDIVKFSDYAASLTPQEIMGNLSLLFAGFDEAISKHDLLIKIKLIGDVYMCAGGLFSPDEPPVNHAEQMLRFGLEALQVLDDTNVKLNAVLNVRIGVNTGGPLIAGVLGTDKPVFDIIGDTINVASRLQSTDIPGKIQISQATFDIVKELDFYIETRGEVFLKGKGKQMAYLVSPIKPMIMQLSSLENIRLTNPQPPQVA
ncbi:Adenylate and Guanylate cyclase catalytic domain containing protein [Tritrichomonas foetus]|uniref:Adenylate and Guanylate cyclase catalytic domain containing protein n=1 Tax=Tritrichomonas foetus TaxID=1144522 RepID=A0A1J4K8X5_9EUKA|nr:Adenylate and Guanylate cyclase catalytic domain containing protein [Tritrichomonas foetus]|eukprot:OHT07667.1 Adenylate and Guanylate cyclase catalytic domain containing protein [Tritrichomonas foetus]